MSSTSPKNPKKIAVFTGTRAEYGLLINTMRELHARGIDAQWIVTGAHLSKEHGYTVEHIEKDGFPIAAKVDMGHLSDDVLDLTKAMGQGLSGMAQALSDFNPDMSIILGDRYEMLVAATVTTMLQSPVAHIHGGEVTEGAMDESIRHAITKLSYWHFPIAEPYAKRIIQLGEHPERVFATGAPGIDNMPNLPLKNREELEKEFGLELKDPIILFTFHPETLCATPVQEQIDQVLAAMKEMPDATWLITGANADSGGVAINKALKEFADNHPRAHFRMSFGSLLYLSAMRIANVVAGNSSSAVIETPVMGRMTVNIGDRQAGRLRADTVIDCACEKEPIIAALKQALSPQAQQSTKPCTFFGTPGKVGSAIAEIISKLDVPATTRKSFHDL